MSTAATHSVFLSYRRADSAGYAGRLHDRLVESLGKQHVFMDIDSISYGEDFVQVITDTLQACKVALVLVGPNWTSVVDENGLRRLDQPNDSVRLEVSMALSAGLKVLPVLVGGAGMPRDEDLPEVLKPLSRRNAIEVSDRRFNADARELVGAITRLLEGPENDRSPPPTADQEAPKGTEHQKVKVPHIEPKTTSSRFTLSKKRALIAIVSVATLLLLVYQPLRFGFLFPTEPVHEQAPTVSAGATAPSPTPPAPSVSTPSSTLPQETSRPFSVPQSTHATSAGIEASSDSKDGMPSSLTPDPSPWLVSRLYGSDNQMAALQKVVIAVREGRFQINIRNQFNFDCDLSMDAAGNPSSLSNCKSREGPTPICDKDRPDSWCAQNLGCFQSPNEKNPKCFNHWQVREAVVPLKCTTLKTEQVCKGKYTLATTSSEPLSGKDEFTIARRL